MRTLTFYVVFTTKEGKKTYQSPNLKIDVMDETPFPSTIAKGHIRDMLNYVVDPELEFEIFFTHST